MLSGNDDKKTKDNVKKKDEDEYSNNDLNQSSKCEIFTILR